MAIPIDFESDGGLSAPSLAALHDLGPADLGRELTALVERMGTLNGRRRSTARAALEQAIVAGSRSSGRPDVTAQVPRLVEVYREASVDPDGDEVAAAAVRLLATTDRAIVLRSIPIDSGGLELRVRLGRALDEEAGIQVPGTRRGASRGLDLDDPWFRDHHESAATAADDAFEPAPSIAPSSGRGIPTHAEPPDRPGPPSAGGEPTAATYKAYGVLACDELVLVGESFPLTVGLGREAPAGVSGPPMSVAVPVEPYDLEVQLFADGFDVAAGESLRNTLRVSEDDRFPTIVVHLTAREMPDEMADREISAAFVIAGEALGTAQRNVRVTKDAAELADRSVQVAAASGTNISTQPGMPKAHLTIIIKRGVAPGSLQWSVESDLVGVRPKQQIEPTDIGDEPVRFAKNLIGQIRDRENDKGIFSLIEGLGSLVAEKVPTEVFDAIRAASDVVKPDRLQILVLTDEPFVPWELAVLDPPLDPTLPAYLGAQANVGRWIYDDKTRSDPNRTVKAGTMAVVSGVYTDVERLLSAEEEARLLGKRYKAREVDASFNPVMALLHGTPPVDIIHFAVHGKFDASNYDEGIILVAGPPLLPLQIRTGKLKGRAPFVFLNACQLGSSAEVLGTYYGTAQAFLRAGASAVIAPLWSVDDQIAQQIALEFYRRALAKPRGKDGQPPLVAELLREVRLGIVEHADKLSATYLAYQFYGHPSLRLSWSPTPSGRDS